MSEAVRRLEFADASDTLEALLLQIEADLTHLKTGTRDYLEDAIERARASWKNWPQTRERYHAALLTLPKELHKREFVKHLTAELDRLDSAAKNFFSTNSLSWNEATSAFHKKVAELNTQLEQFSKNPLIEKCLRGEMILSSRKTIQWQRKLGHMLLGLFFLWMFRFSGWNPSFVYAITGAFLIWAFSLETARHLSPRVNALVCTWFKPVMREREKNKINSGIFYIISMVTVNLIFPPDITLLTMLFLAVGDPVAGVVGVKWGKHPLSSHSSWEGSIACFIVCTLLAFLSAQFLFVDFHLSIFKLFIFSGIAGFIGAYAESSLKFLDDNLVMPLVSAPLLYLLIRIL